MQEFVAWLAGNHAALSAEPLGSSLLDIQVVAVVVMSVHHKCFCSRKYCPNEY